MKNSIALKGILVVAGLVAMGFGAAILFFPVSFYAINGVTVGGDINVLSDLRAGGGVILVFGVFFLIGAFKAGLQFMATIVATMLYLSYGLSRIIAVFADGVPVEGLIQAMVLEIIIGMGCVFALYKYQLRV